MGMYRWKDSRTDRQTKRQLYALPLGSIKITAQLLVKGFWFLHSALLLIALSQCVEFHLIPIHNFRDMPHTNLLQNWGNNSVITCDWVMVLELCISSHCSLSMCQVAFKSPQYFQIYAPDKPIITKIRKGNNSVIICDRAMLLAFKLSLIALY